MRLMLRTQSRGIANSDHPAHLGPSAYGLPLDSKLKPKYVPSKLPWPQPNAPNLIDIDHLSEGQKISIRWAR